MVENKTMLWKIIFMNGNLFRNHKCFITIKSENPDTIFDPRLYKEDLTLLWPWQQTMQYPLIFFFISITLEIIQFHI